MRRLPWLHLEVDDERASPAFHSYLKCQAERVGALRQRVPGILQIPSNWQRICLRLLTSFRERARRLCVFPRLDLKSEPQYVLGELLAPHAFTAY